MHLYYSIWVDCLARLKAQRSNQNNWRIKAITLMTAAMTFNWLLFIKIAEFGIVGHSFYEIDLYFLPYEIGAVLEFLILFVAPFIVANYLLIFRNNRYEQLLRRYPNKDGRLFLPYFLGSLIIPIVLMWAVILFGNSV